MKEIVFLLMTVFSGGQFVDTQVPMESVLECVDTAKKIEDDFKLNPNGPKQLKVLGCAKFYFTQEEYEAFQSPIQ